MRAKPEEHCLRLVYTATTDQPTAVNLTLHPYFNLTGETTVEQHWIQVAASHFTPTTPDNLPTGQVANLAGTALDCRRARQLGQLLTTLAQEGRERAGGLNHCFLVEGSGLREHVRLSGGGLSLVVKSDAPAVQLYSADHLDRPGLAIEPQDCPDTPNRSLFPAVILRPGETYRREIELIVT